MATNLKASYNTGSGAVVDIVTSVTVEDTRIRSIHAVGSGEWTVSSTNALGGVSRIRFQVSGTASMDLTDCGVRMSGPVFVNAPASASYITIFYG